MGEKKGINGADIFPQTLEAEFGGGIDNEFDLRSLNIDRWPRAMVFWVLEKGGRIIPRDDGNPLGSSRS
jgi:hypothetical protein